MGDAGCMVLWASITVLGAYMVYAGKKHKILIIDHVKLEENVFAFSFDDKKKHVVKHEFPSTHHHCLMIAERGKRKGQ